MNHPDKKRILIIDDQEDFAFTMKFFLENSNFQVETALNGPEGLAKIFQNAPDLVLLDLDMPKMNGHEVCRLLKENPSTAHIPVMMLSSRESTIEKIEALDLGAADYMCKIFPLEEVLARIKAVLRARVFTSSDEKDDAHQKILEIRRIIDSSGFDVLLQPLVEFANRKVFAYEALSRPQKSGLFKNPAEFFEEANKLNLLTELDNAVRRMTIKKAGRFLADGKSLFLNIDANILADQSFMNLDFLKDSKVSPAQLCFEITERTYIKNYQTVIDRIKPFREKGIRFAVDDVGEGYSSLKAIAEIHPDVLKIDIAIIRGIDSDPVKIALVQMISDLGKKVGSKTLAEGVETEAEYRKLLELGVDYGQGFLFARPEIIP